jgi:hypothetical protein
MVSLLTKITMRKYHITFFPAGEIISTGITIEAYTPIEALARFELQYPDAIFLYIASSEMFNLKP